MGCGNTKIQSIDLENNKDVLPKRRKRGNGNKRTTKLSDLEILLLTAEIRDAILINLNFIDRNNLKLVNRTIYNSCNHFIQQNLNFEDEERLNNDNLTNYIFSLDLEQLWKIKSLCLQGTRVNLSCVFIPVVKCSNLERIELTEGQVSKKLLHVAAKCLLNLKTLKLINTSFVNIHTVKYIGKIMSFLQGLYLPFSKNLDDKGLKVIANKMVKLKELSISGCENVTDYGLRSIIFHCEDLEYLDASDTNTFTYPSCILMSKASRNIHKIVAINTRMVESGYQVLKMRPAERGLVTSKTIVVCKPKCQCIHCNCCSKDSSLKQSELSKSDL